MKPFLQVLVMGEFALLLPGVAIAWTFRAPPGGRRRWRALLTALLSCACFALSRWDLLSLSLRWVTLVGLIPLLWPAHPAPNTPPRAPAARFPIESIGALIFISGVAWHGLADRTTPVFDLAESPICEAQWYVAQGGPTLLTNRHVLTPQPLAVDIVVLGPDGRSRRFWSGDEPANFRAFGVEVCAPCAGELARVVDRYPDTGVEQGADNGNYILLKCSKATVLLSHLKSGSSSDLTVGQRVKAGDPLAQVGNSGHSSEPHLHLFVVSGDDLHGGRPLMPTFRGSSLIRNDVAPKTLGARSGHAAPDQDVPLYWPSVNRTLGLAG